MTARRRAEEGRPWSSIRQATVVPGLAVTIGIVVVASLHAGNRVLDPAAAIGALVHGGDTPAAPIVTTLRLPRCWRARAWHRTGASRRR